MNKANQTTTISIIEMLRNEGFYMGPPVGISMQPMLRNRNDVILVKPTERKLQPKEVALYCRNSDYVLHRVLAYYQDGYIICGDNCINLEYIPYENVIGVLHGFYRNYRYIDCELSKTYRLYSHICVVSYPIRKKYIQLKVDFKRIIKTILS